MLISNFLPTLNSKIASLTLIYLGDWKWGAGGSPGAGGTCIWEGLTARRMENSTEAGTKQNWLTLLQGRMARSTSWSMYWSDPQSQEVSCSGKWVLYGCCQQRNDRSELFLVFLGILQLSLRFCFRSSDDNWNVEKHHSKRCILFLDALFELPSYNCWVKKNILLVSLISKGKTTQLTTVKY